MMLFLGGARVFHPPLEDKLAFEQLSNVAEKGCKGPVVILLYAALGKTLYWAPVSNLYTSWTLPKLTASSQSLSVCTQTAPMNISSES